MKYIISDPYCKLQIHSIITAITNVFDMLLMKSHFGKNFQSIILFNTFSLSASGQQPPMELITNTDT